MGNCCLKDQISYFQQMAEKEFQRNISGSQKKVGSSLIQIASLVDIDEEAWDQSVVSGSNYNQKESHKETFRTNDHSISIMDATRSPHENRENDKNDIQYFRPVTPLSSQEQFYQETVIRTSSARYIPHRFSSNNQEDLRGTTVNYEKGNRFQAGLSVITEVNPMWQSSHIGKTELGSSSSVALRLTDKFSGGSLVLKGSNGSHFSNGSMIRKSKESKFSGQDKMNELNSSK